MKILQTKTAPNPRRVRIFLAEKGIEVPYEELDILKGLKTPEFTRLNPLPARAGADPRRRHGDRRDHGDLPLFRGDEAGAGPVRQGRQAARADRDVEPAHGAGAAGSASLQAFRHLHPAAAQLEVPQVPAWGEANKPKAQEVLRILDEELGKRRFIAGDEYSVADITALVAVDFTKPARVERPPGLDNLARWHQEVSARPSAKA